MNKTSVLICLTLCLVGCSGKDLSQPKAEGDIDRAVACPKGAGTMHDPCVASIYEISGSPQLYDGKYIEAVAYYPGSGSVSLYFSEDSADSVDTLSSLLMSNALSTDDGYVLFVGLFRYDKSDQGSMAYRQFGMLDDVRLIRSLGSLSARLSACEEEKCRIDYRRSGGLLPEFVERE